MSRCPSCDVPLSEWELTRKIRVYTGEDESAFIDIDESFCNRCLRLYVSHADDLETHEYQFSEITDDFAILAAKAKENSYYD
jgi:hypothetical protein